MSRIFDIFIDETGDDSPAATNDPNRRFLAITGVIFERDYHNGAFLQEFNRLRIRHFGLTDGKPVHLHRRKMIRAENEFHVLTEPNKRDAWNQGFMKLVTESPFTVITSCIDKIAFYYRYPKWQDDPYRLCFFNALERFFFYVRDKDGIGHVTAETINEGRDRQLRNAYRDFWNKGSGSKIEKSYLQKRFAPPEINFAKKSDDVPGIQMADLLGKPAFSACRMIYTKVDEFTDFSKEVARVIELKKFYRNGTRVDGHGRHWRPDPGR